MFKYLVVAASLLIGSAANAAVKLDDGILYITGATTKGQAGAVRRVLDKQDVRRVVMYGRGGNYFAGLSIGYAIRQKDLTVTIPTGRQCISACALGAMGGERVMLGGQLWFHKAYRQEYGTLDSLEDIDKGGQSVGAAFMHYAYLVGAPVNFVYEVIHNTSSCKFLIIDTTSEMRKMMAHTGHDKLAYKRRFYNGCNR